MKCKAYTATNRKTEVNTKDIDQNFQNALYLRDTKNRPEIEK